MAVVENENNVIGHTKGESGKFAKTIFYVLKTDHIMSH